MKTMQMREFLRGGYKDITEMTLVTNHSRPAFTVNPHNKKKEKTVTVSYTAAQVVDSEKPTP